MLGRTHMAVGAGAACLLLPVVLQSSGIPAWHDITSGNWPTLNQSAEFVAASVVGSIAPDLDESHSLLAQKVEVLGRLLLLIAIIGLTLWAHIALTPLVWVAWSFLAFSVLARANWARKIALLALAAGAIYAAGLGVMSTAGGIGLALWCIGAAFTSHRTWTHSLAGLASLIPEGIGMMNHGLALWAIGFVIGYVLHLIADFVSGGVPLFYPLGKKRLGFRLVRTGGWTDHAIGAGATFVALATLFL